MKSSLILLLVFFGCQSLAADINSVRIEKDIHYSDAAADRSNMLDVYRNEDGKKGKDVLVFIHGGSWNSGNKEVYWWLGRNLARKGKVAVIINYPLSPKHGFEKMAQDAALAVKWVTEHIETYGGNADRIFLMGHSAGAHLSALIDSDPRYFQAAGLNESPVKGVILNDPFGLDMYEYMTQAPQDDPLYQSFLVTFTDEEDNWKKGSPISYLENIRSKYLIWVGDQTYPAIQLQSKRFAELLQKANKPVELREIRGKKHVAMMSQFVLPSNPLYDQILAFMAD